MRNLFKDEAGAAIMEFALLLLPMVVLMAGVVESGRLLFTRITLESAVMEGARLATARMESTQEERYALMQETIENRMASFPTYEDQPLEIETLVYRDFGSSFPENYEDANGNGRYDPPQAQSPGEPFMDRNNNGLWDPATPKPGTMGGPGDVVSYTARLQAPLFFGLLNNIGAMPTSFALSATTVVRNEPVARRING